MASLIPHRDVVGVLTLLFAACGTGPARADNELDQEHYIAVEIADLIVRCTRAKGLTISAIETHEMTPADAAVRYTWPGCDKPIHEIVSQLSALQPEAGSDWCFEGGRGDDSGGTPSDSSAGPRSTDGVGALAGTERRAVGVRWKWHRDAEVLTITTPGTRILHRTVPPATYTGTVCSIVESLTEASQDSSGEAVISLCRTQWNPGNAVGTSSLNRVRTLEIAVPTTIEAALVSLISSSGQRIVMASTFHSFRDGGAGIDWLVRGGDPLPKPAAPVSR